MSGCPKKQSIVLPVKKEVLNVDSEGHLTDEPPNLELSDSYKLSVFKIFTRPPGPGRKKIDLGSSFAIELGGEVGIVTNLHVVSTFGGGNGPCVQCDRNKCFADDGSINKRDGLCDSHKTYEFFGAACDDPEHDGEVFSMNTDVFIQVPYNDTYDFNCELLPVSVSFSADVAVLVFVKDHHKNMVKPLKLSPYIMNQQSANKGLLVGFNQGSKEKFEEDYTEVKSAEEFDLVTRSHKMSANPILINDFSTKTCCSDKKQILHNAPTTPCRSGSAVIQQKEGIDHVVGIHVESTGEMFKDGSCNSLNYAFPFNEEFISRMNAALIEGNRMKKKSHEERKNLRIDRSKLIRSKRKMDHEEAITAYKFGILKKKIEIERMEEQLEKLVNIIHLE
eukprot:TRINITY_DN498081_c0_g1_i5.p1 TRINITY_DN498081_c0_g1~~TRINITY_DN498081_c0_g1_i5.p1  ORF type:complete len:391 (+),score=47.71 TRINITY_DN498081_c0_g1_i5:94-1266(+)